MLSTKPAAMPRDFRPVLFMRRPATKPPAAALVALIIVIMEPTPVDIEKEYFQNEITKVVIAAVAEANMIPTRQATADLFVSACFKPASGGILCLDRISIFFDGRTAKANRRLPIETGRLNQSITVRQVPKLVRSPVIGAPTLNARNPAATIQPTARPFFSGG